MNVGFVVDGFNVYHAAKEAVQGIGFDLLIVCGFAFDPHVSEEAKRYGNLQVLIARHCDAEECMETDLSRAGELGLPFDVSLLSTVFPPLAKLRRWVYPAES